MCSPTRRFVFLLLLLPTAFFQTQCTEKKENGPAKNKTNPAAAAAYASGFRKQQQDNFEGAAIEYTKAIEIDPAFIDAYRNRADVRRAKGDAKGAIADYTKVMELDPKNSLACHSRGVVRNKEGDVDGALADFSQAIAINPKFDAAYSSRAEIQNNKGEYAGAIEDYTKVIQLVPEDAPAYRGRGRARFEQADHEGAIADFTKAIELDPGDSSAFQARGLAYACGGQWPKAADDFDKAYRAAASNLYLALYRWAAQTRAGQDGAPALRTALNKAREGRSGADEWEMKVAHFILGGMEEAELLVMASSGGAERARGQTCQAWCYVGFAHLGAGRKDEAVDCFQKCLATERKSLIEYRLAKEELARLESKN